MNSPDIKSLKVKVDVIRKYYVQTPDGWIYGGPFDTKQEAINCLEEAKRIDAEHPIKLSGDLVWENRNPEGGQD